MIPRKASETLMRLAKGFPILVITGPRQSGKTTLAKSVFSNKPYISLENLDERSFANQDPKRFLARFPDGAIFDEVQRCPSILSWLQGLVDERQRMGDFILTGSAQLDLMSGISQTLAGRVGRVELLPLSAKELVGYGLSKDLNTLLMQGGFPAIFDRNLSLEDWFSNYVATYVERDVRQILAIQDLNRFQRFIRLCAARSAQLLNLSSLASDCGITSVTAKEWLSVLETCYLVKIVHPYYQNFGKRLVKTPKLFFLDVGLMAWLLGIKHQSQLELHPQRGHLFETWVVTEFLKDFYNQGSQAPLFFWRDHNGQEIDLLIQKENGLQAIEVKSGATITSDWPKTISSWQKHTNNTIPPLIIYGGQIDCMVEKIYYLSWRSLCESDMESLQ
jgi:hypothetical protein